MHFFPHCSRALLIFSSFLLVGTAYAFDVPANDAFVTDEVGILEPHQEEQLETILSTYQQETSNEIAIVIVPSTGLTSSIDAAVQIGRKWGVGDDKKNNGIIILLAYEDREVFIAPGYGLEGPLPDIVVKGIIDKEVLPRFRDGQFFDGLLFSVEALQKHIGGEYTAERYEEEAAPIWMSWLFVGFFILLQWLVAYMASTKSWWLGGALGAAFGVVLTILQSWWLSIPILVALGLGFDYLVSKPSSPYNQAARRRRRRGGGFWGGGGGGSGGGFGGFGGGGFGGGGSIGRW